MALVFLKIGPRRVFEKTSATLHGNPILGTLGAVLGSSWAAPTPKIVFPPRVALVFLKIGPRRVKRRPKTHFRRIFEKTSATLGGNPILGTPGAVLGSSWAAPTPNGARFPNGSPHLFHLGRPGGVQDGRQKRRRKTKTKNKNEDEKRHPLRSP